MPQERPHPLQFATSPRPGDTPPASTPGEPVHIGEELDELEKESRIQTFLVVGVVLVIIAAIIGIFAYTMRPKPKATGAIDEAYAVALPGDNVLATIRVTFHNVGGKPLYIRDIKGKLVAEDGNEYTDVAANAVDFDRYFRAFPDLRDHSIQPLKVEARLEPGEQTRGSVVVRFPVTLDAFNARKALSVIIQPYAGVMSPSGGDEAPVIITK
ncbi:MAG: hypothetical protein ACE14L_08175 [Terriglobales bacterium]